MRFSAFLDHRRCFYERGFRCPLIPVAVLSKSQLLVDLLASARYCFVPMVRVATLLTLALASFCAASPVLVKRNVTLIGLDIDAVAAQVTVVDNALKAFK